MKTITIAIALLCVAGPAAAQRQLDRADSLLNAGRYPEARAALADWQRSNPAGNAVDPVLRAKALYLNARLTEDAQQALELYLTIALSYPTARETPDALLRLGQGLLATNEPRRASGYLERLVSDYPSAPNRGVAYLWLTRAQIASRQHAAACTTAGAALRIEGLPDDVIASLNEAEKAACAGPSATSAQSTERVQPPVTRADPDRSAARDTSTPPVRVSPPTRPTDTRETIDSSARFAVQTGAFRNTQSANNVASGLRKAGFDARVALLTNSDLAHVRIGRFRNRSDAVEAAARAREAGYDAIIVDDVVRERR